MRILQSLAARRRLIAGFVMAAALAVWVFRAHILLAGAPLLERKGEAGGEWLRDRLMACGPSSVGPTIATLRRESPWTRTYGGLPLVLRHFGEPAHQQLLEAIDSEAEHQARAFLISTLQRGFGDYSRFDLCKRQPRPHYERAW